MEPIEKALKEGRATLSEYESKLVLASYGIPVTKELLVDKVQDLINAAKEIGYPLVLKGCSSGIAHKTEKGLIRVDIRNEAEAKAAGDRYMAHGEEGRDLSNGCSFHLDLGNIVQRREARQLLLLRCEALVRRARGSARRTHERLVESCSSPSRRAARARS